MLRIHVDAFLARLYESTGRAIQYCNHPGVGVGVSVHVVQMLKFLVKVFISLYLLNMLMDKVDILHVSRYWSEVLCSTIMTHPG